MSFYFEFFEIYQQVGLTVDVDGIIGMSRAWHEEGFYSTGPLIIEGLYNNSIISQKVFAFHIGD